jgi:hypothetical protein
MVIGFSANSAGRLLQIDASGAITQRRTLAGGCGASLCGMARDSRREMNVSVETQLESKSRILRTLLIPATALGMSPALPEIRLPLELARIAECAIGAYAPRRTSPDARVTWHASIPHEARRFLERVPTLLDVHSQAASTCALNHRKTSSSNRMVILVFPFADRTTAPRFALLKSYCFRIIVPRTAVARAVSHGRRRVHRARVLRTPCPRG